MDSRRSICLVETDRLTVHPYNEKIFHDHVDNVLDLDIASYGIRSPVVINRKYQILDGRRRYLRAKKFGITQIPCVIENYDDEELAILMLNKYRQKSPRELFMEAEELEKKYKEMFPVGRPRGTKDQQERCQRLTTFSSIRDKISSELDLSSGKLYQLKTIYRNEHGIPGIVKALDNGTISVNAAFNLARSVLEDGLPEQDALERAFRLSSKVISKKKKVVRPRTRSDQKEYVVCCPMCSELVLCVLEKKKGAKLMKIEEARKHHLERMRERAKNRTRYMRFSP